MSVISKLVSLSPTQQIATSLILKDVVGCYLYVNQARKNKKFTPEQRADVANYDLANGVINIGLQLAAVKPIENLMKKFVGTKLMGKMFQNLDTRLADPNNQKVMKLLKNKTRLTEGIVAAFSVIICQYFIKRVVSPFFSVPIGEKTKQIGIVKPKLYEGETYTGKSGDKFEKLENKVESIKDKIEDKFEDKFELQKEDD